MSLSMRVAHNTIIQLVGKFISTALGLVAVSIMTRYLGQFGFGQYTTIITFLSFFGVIIDFGLTLVTTQMMGQPGIDQDKTLSNLFTLRLTSALVFLGLGPLVVFLFPYDQIIKIGVMVTTLSFFFVSLNQILTGLFQKVLRTDKIAISEVAGRILFLAGIIAAVYFHWGLMGIMVATVLSSALSFILNYVFSLSLSRIRLAYDKEVWKEIFHKSWPLAVTIVFNLIYLKTDTLILSLVKTQEEVGIYGAAYKVIDILVTVPFMFAGLILPIMSSRWALNDKEGFKNIFQKSFDAMAIFAIPMFVGMQFVAVETMRVIAGREFSVAGGVLKILIAAASIIFLGTIFSHSVIAVNRQKNLISGYVFTSITALAGYIIFIPIYSYYGAAWVTIYSELSIALFTFYIFWKHARILPSLTVSSKALAAALVMGAALYFVSYHYNNLFFLLIFGALVYFIALYAFRGLNFLSLKETFNLQK